MNKEGGSTLTIRKSNRVTDGFKGYKATLFAGERAYVEISIEKRIVQRQIDILVHIKRGFIVMGEYKALLMTLGLSAINTPFPGSIR